MKHLMKSSFSLQCSRGFARARSHRGLCQPAQHQDRALASAGRKISHCRILVQERLRRHPSHLHRGRRHRDRRQEPQGEEGPVLVGENEDRSSRKTRHVFASQRLCRSFGGA